MNKKMKRVNPKDLKPGDILLLETDKLAVIDDGELRELPVVERREVYRVQIEKTAGKGEVVHVKVRFGIFEGMVVFIPGVDEDPYILDKPKEEEEEKKETKKKVIKG